MSITSEVLIEQELELTANCEAMSANEMCVPLKDELEPIAALIGAAVCVEAEYAL